LIAPSPQVGQLEPVTRCFVKIGVLSYDNPNRYPDRDLSMHGFEQLSWMVLPPPDPLGGRRVGGWSCVVAHGSSVGPVPALSSQRAGFFKS